MQNTKSTKLPFLVLHPYSRYRIAWDLLVMLLLLENMIMVSTVKIVTVCTNTS